MSTAKPLFKITEKGLQDSTVRMAKLFRWKVFHTYDSRRSEPGFPDLCMVRGARLIFAELKSDTGRVTPEQTRWLNSLTEVAEVYIWRPVDWTSGEIENILR